MYFEHYGKDSAPFSFKVHHYILYTILFLLRVKPLGALKIAFPLRDGWFGRKPENVRVKEYIDSPRQS